MKITEAYAEYTGGNIWIFYGSTSDGQHFITDDDGATTLFNADASKAIDFEFDEWNAWVSEHMIKELAGNEREKFCDDLCDYLLTADDKHRGGMTDQEIEAYRNYFKEEY